MSKIKIRLRDSGTIFHDASQDVTLTGTQIAEAVLNAKVASALRNGVLEKVEEKELVTPVVTTDASKEGGNDPKADDATNHNVDNKVDDTLDGKDADVNDTGNAVDYTKLKKAELLDLLQAREIPHNPQSTNVELISLLVASDQRG